MRRPKQRMSYQRANEIHQRQEGATSVHDNLWLSLVLLSSNDRKRVLRQSRQAWSPLRQRILASSNSPHPRSASAAQRPCIDLQQLQ